MTVPQLTAQHNTKSLFNASSALLFLSWFKHTKPTFSVLKTKNFTPTSVALPAPFLFSGDARQLPLDATLEPVLESCLRANYNVYFCPNQCSSVILEGRKTIAAADNVTHINAVFCDVDGDLAACTKIYNKCKDLGFVPTLCVDSGGRTGSGRVHFYWILDNPLPVNPTLVSDWKRVMEWFAVFGADPTVKDLSRKMRLVGSTNLSRSKPCCFSTEFTGSEQFYSFDALKTALLSDEDYLDIVSNAERVGSAFSSALGTASNVDFFSMLSEGNKIDEGNRHYALMSYIRFLMFYRNVTSQAALVSKCIAFVTSYFDTASVHLFLPGGARFQSDVVRLVSDSRDFYNKYINSLRSVSLSLLEESIPFSAVAAVAATVEPVANVSAPVAAVEPVASVSASAPVASVASVVEVTPLSSEPTKKRALDALGINITECLESADDGLSELEARANVANNWCLNVHFLQMCEVVLKECVIVAGRLHVYNGKYYRAIDRLTADGADTFLRGFVSKHKWNWWQSVNKQGGIDVSELDVITANHLSHLRKVFMGALNAAENLVEHTYGQWLDGSVEPHVLCLKNGLYDVSRGVLLPHSRNYVSSGITLFDFVEGAECPVFMKFIRDSLCSACAEIEDAKQRAKQEALIFKGIAMCLGLAIAPDSYKTRKILLFTGESGAGKSLLLKVFRWLVGDSYCFSLTKNEISKENRFALAPMPGKKLCIMDDYNLGSMTQSEITFFNGLTGGLAMPIEFKGGQKIDYLGNVLPIITTNYTPEFGIDKGGAFVKRLVLFECARARDAHDDAELATKLYGEMSGILNFALKGLRAVLKGESVPVAAHNADKKDSISTEMRDTVEAFVEDTYEIMPDSLEAVYSSDFYSDFVDYATRSGVLESGNAFDKKTVRNERSFHMKLSAVLKKHGIKKTKQNNRHIYFGVLKKK